MRRTRTGFLFVFLAVHLLLAGCAEEPLPPAAPAAKKKVAPAPAPVPVPAAAEAPAPPPSPPKYAYDPSGRRDPFTPLTMVKKPVSQNVPLTPLQTYDLGQLRLIGVIVGKGAPTAMVTAPDGKSYILKKGTRVGKNDGVVVGIKPDTVLVEERYYDFSGVIRKNVESIQLPKR